MSSDNSIRCQIKRSERPCLVCTGHMDLIEARPRKFNLFGGIPFVCGSEGIDCLDCPKCGFKTTTVDYEYLRMCKNDRKGTGMFIDTTMNSTERTRKRRSQSTGATSSERTCSSCQATLASNTWQFCPNCGKKCSSSMSVSRSPSPGTPKAVIEIIVPNTASKDVIVNDDDNSITMNDTYQEPSFSKAADSGIIRMVTPPPNKRETRMSTDFNSPVTMQY